MLTAHSGRQLLAPFPHPLRARARGPQGRRRLRNVQGGFAAGGLEEADQEAPGGSLHEREEQVVLPASPRAYSFRVLLPLNPPRDRLAGLFDESKFFRLITPIDFNFDPDVRTRTDIHPFLQF